MILYIYNIFWIDDIIYNYILYVGLIETISILFYIQMKLLGG